MCLNGQVSLTTKNQRFKVSKDEKGYYGWKVYEFVDYEYMRVTPQHYGVDQPMNKWINSERYGKAKNIKDGSGKFYKAGFHVYFRQQKTYREAFCKKVYIKGIIAKGFQFPKTPVMICKRIFIVGRKRS